MQVVVLVLQAVELDQYVVVHVSLLHVEFLVLFELGQLLLHLVHQVHALVHLQLLIGVYFMQSLLQFAGFLPSVSPPVPQVTLY